MIYVIQGEHGGPVKIGWTNSGTALHRLKGLQTGNHKPLVIRETFDGTREDEDMIHTALRDYHLHGEWFAVTDPIEDHYVFRYVRAYRQANETPEAEVADHDPSWWLHTHADHADRAARELLGAAA